ncbi:MAG TPA: hypothetical protein VKE92_00185 [Anaerolineales bacterium]|nr:hypothetical protein [Anaerolineales bacterium]
MNDSIENPTLGEPSPNFQISFREDLPEPEREVAEHSVATLIARAEERFARFRYIAEEQTRLRSALNAPIQRLVEQDHEAHRALDELRNQDLIHPDMITALGPEPLPVMSGHFTMPFDPFNFPTTAEVAALRPRILDVRVPPYDFTFSFSTGNPPFQQVLNNTTGQVGLQSRSGQVDGGASGFVRAHAGFGVVFTTDHASMARGHSFRRMRYTYAVNAIGLGGNATSEGGMDFGAFEDGRLLDTVSSTLWHKRVSSDDDLEQEDVGPFAVFEPDELAFPVEPGHLYAFPVGIWVFSDREPGWGVAAALSMLQGKIFAISIDR